MVNWIPFEVNIGGILMKLQQSAMPRGRAAGRLVALWITAFCVTAASAQPSLSHAPDLLFHDGMQGVTAGPFNDSDASRFLTQATFGPTDAEIAHLRAVGFEGWLNEQFAATPTYELDYLNWISSPPLNEQVGLDNRQEAWMLGALGGPDPQDIALIHIDQLRQRVAFALSEILVVSQQSAGLNDWPKGLAYYYDILIQNALGNYRTLLGEVTLSPAMGVYLNMMGNRRANLSQNQHPDENYAREINQLFSIGLVMLKPDGTPQMSGGNTIPTYSQSTITNFAHVLTGWNWASCDADGHDNFTTCFRPYQTPDDFLTPMVPYETPPPLSPNAPNYHDDGSSVATGDISNKQLLQYDGAVNSGMLADGGSAAGDLAFALDNIYNHPNVGPFLARQLIQRLVTSNPSPAYVQRVAAVFDANRASGTQLQAVVRAILLDTEARYGQWHSPDTFGKMREPLLAVTHYWRAMHAQHHCGKDIAASQNSAAINYADQPYRYGGFLATRTGDTRSGVAQASLDAPTVFNFFGPSYMPPGEMTTRGLAGPEFQLQTDSVIVNSNNTVAGRTFYLKYDPLTACDPASIFGEVMVDFSPDLALAGSGTGGPPDALVDAYNRRFMSGQMSPFMRQALIDYLSTIDSSNWGTYWPTKRVKLALFAILSSPEYMTQK